jgi:hypothetical protein
MAGRYIAIVAAIALIGYPAFLIYGMTVPVPRFRTGRPVDFLSFVATILAVYGGVLLGVATLWVRTGLAWDRLRPLEVFKAGIWGPCAIASAVVIGAGLRGLIARGSFQEGIGNLWGLLVIFALLFGALVSGGTALLFRGARPRSPLRGDDHA